MSRYIPVEPEKWAEMVKAMALVPKLQAKIEELNQRWPNYHVDALIKAQAKVADLKAEVKKWQRAEAAVGEKVMEVCEENVRLKAEVERLRNLGIKLDGYVDLVRHENERLRKAGDAMADLLSCAGSPPNVVQSWNAAKEGKQS